LLEAAAACGAELWLQAILLPASALLSHPLAMQLQSSSLLTPECSALSLMYQCFQLFAAKIATLVRKPQPLPEVHHKLCSISALPCDILLLAQLKA
jgi:hypothetical protein